MKNLTVALLLIGNLYSCKMGVKDCGGYILSENPEYGENLTLSYADTSAYYQWEDGSQTLQKGVFLKYISGNKIDTVFIWEGSIVIEAHINDINYDRDFIIIDQRPLDSIWGYVLNVNSTPKREKQFDNAREAINHLENSNIHNFWIIDKDLKKIYGPMKKSEYMKKRKELKIPKGLIFRKS